MPSKFDYLFHCTVPKAGSTWFSSLFSHPWVQEASSLTPVNFGYWLIGQTGTNALERLNGPPVTISEQFGSRVALSPVYCTPGYFLQLADGLPHSVAVAVLRDPRDLIVSEYFSVKHSHPVNGQTLQSVRDELQSVGVRDGLNTIMRINLEIPYHAGMADWMRLATEDARVLVVKFEDVFGSRQAEAVRRVFEHCDIHLEGPRLRELLQAFSFEAFSGGRKPGTEDPSAHWRKGVAGDWKLYFDDATRRTYVDMFGDLPERLGYEPTLRRGA
jgi:hypothetical protein